MDTNLITKYEKRSIPSALSVQTKVPFDFNIVSKEMIMINPIENAASYSPGSTGTNTITYKIMASGGPMASVYIDMRSIWFKWNVKTAVGRISENIKKIIREVRIRGGPGFQTICELTDFDIYTQLKDCYKSRQMKASEYESGYDLTENATSEFLKGIKKNDTVGSEYIFTFKEGIFSQNNLLPIGAFPLLFEFVLCESARCGIEGLTGYSVEKPRLYIDYYNLTPQYHQTTLKMINSGQYFLKFNCYVSTSENAETTINKIFNINRKRVKKITAVFVNKAALNDGSKETYKFIRGKGSVDDTPMTNPTTPNPNYGKFTGTSDGVTSFRIYYGKYTHKLETSTYWDGDSSGKQYFYNFKKTNNLHELPYYVSMMSNDYMKDVPLSTADTEPIRLIDVTELPKNLINTKYFILSHKLSRDPSNQIESGYNFKALAPTIEIEMKAGSGGGGNAGLRLYLFAEYTNIVQIKLQETRVDY